jgi:flagellin-like protein
MKANRKFKEDEEAVSAVIGVILMVAITVAIAATVYVYVSGMMGSPQTEQENASVAVRAENGRIKITLATGGNNYPATGYSINPTSPTVKIRVQGTLEDVSGAADNYFEVGESLYVANDTAGNIILYDSASSGSALEAGDYSVTVTVVETVIYDDSVRIV